AVAVGALSQKVDAGSPATVTATVTDSGTPIAGATVEFSTSTSGATISGPTSCTTGADGTCAVTVDKPDFGVVDVEARGSLPGGSGGSAPVVGSYQVGFQAPWSLAPVATSPPTITLKNHGPDLEVAVDSNTQARPALTVKTLTIDAPADTALVVDKTGRIAAPITYNATGSASSLEVKGDTATWTLDHANGNGTVTTPTADLTLTFSNVWTVKATGTEHTLALAGPSPNTTWVVTGQGSGTTSPTDPASRGVSFAGFTNLKGAADNRDEFVIGQNGAVTSVDGGDRGFDKLVIQGTHDSVVSKPTSPSAGSIVVDGRTISYEGLEPVTITGTTNVTVEANDCDVPILCDETITIEQDSGTGEVTVDSLLMERHDITMPASGGSLTILGKGGKDTVQFTTDLVLPKVDLTVDAENIEVEDVTIDTRDTVGTAHGSVTLTAFDKRFKTNFLFTANPSASITVSNATITGGALSLTATASATPNGPSTLTATPSATGGALGEGKYFYRVTAYDGSDETRGGVETSATTTGTTGSVALSWSPIPGATEYRIYRGSPPSAERLIIALSSASVSIDDSTLTSTGATTIASTSVVSAIAEDVASASEDVDDTDVALSSVGGDSDATTDVTGSSAITIAGALQITATNTLYASAASDAHFAQSGAGVAVVLFPSATTRASLQGSDTTVNAGSLTIMATSVSSTITSAIASQGGASGNDDGDSTTTDDSPDATTGGNADTSSGTISVAGALASSTIVGTTSAFIDLGGTSPSTVTTTTGAQTVRSSATNTSTAVADGSPVEPSDDSSTNSDGSTNTKVGVAIAVNVAKLTNEAYVAGNVSVSAPLSARTITIEAIAPAASTYGATATSGVGNADEVTVAGSLAVNIVVADTTASLKGAVAVASGNDVHLAASSNATNEAKALVAKQLFDPAKATETGANEITLPYSIKKGDGSDIATGDKVVYKANGGTPIGNLEDGKTYCAKVNASDSKKIALVEPDDDDNCTSSTAIDIDLTVATGTEHQLRLDAPPGDSDSTGVGVSVALDIADDDTTAELAPSATLTGARDLQLRATTTNAMTTKAENGASGGTGVAGSLALSFSLLNTRVSIGSGTLLTLTGSLDAEASQTASVTTDAIGDAVGSDTAVGVALALGVAVHNADAYTDRAITTTGTGTAGRIRFAAYGTSSNGTNATASAAGAEGEDETTHEDSSGKNVNEKGDQELTNGNAKANANNGGTKDSGQTSTKKAATSEGDTDGDGEGDSVSVAAAIAFNVSITTYRAQIPNGTGMPINSGGPLALDAQGRTVARAKADGKATKSTTAVGAGVAVNYAKSSIFATIGEQANVTANGVTLNAGIRGPPTPPATAAQHEIQAEATAGAGGEDTGVAGALAINIVENDTQAVIYRRTAVSGAQTTVNAGTGDVSLTASHVESDTAKAEAAAEGGDVGVGASIALNILFSTDTRAEIENGVAISNGDDVTVSASSERTVVTAVKAGSKGGTAITPAVALALDVDDKTVARVGSGSTWTATGDVSVSATHTMDASGTKGEAKAEGDDTAVGANVAINVIVFWDTNAEIARSMNADSFQILASSTMNSASEAKASASGADSSDSNEKNSDDKSNAQVKDNPNTSDKGTGDLPKASDKTTEANGKSSEESGEQGGGVGVAAAIAVNWVDSENRAKVADGVTLTATSGAVTVRASYQVDATAKATGIALTSSGGDANVGAAVGLNVLIAENEAIIGDHATVSGAGITVEAITPASERNDFVVWGLAAGGGKSDVGVAASIGVMYVDFETTAKIGVGANVDSTDTLTVNATNNFALQNLAVSGALAISGSAAVGGAIAVNIFNPLSTRAYIDSGTSGSDVTYVDAAKGMTVSATTTLSPITFDIPVSFIPDPSLTSVALAGGAGTGSNAVSGSVIVDVWDMRTYAYIADGAQVNQDADPISTDPDQDITVSVTDSTEITNVAGALSLTTGSAGVGVGLIVEVMNKDDRAFIGKSADVNTGGDVSITATSTEDILEIAMSAGATTGSVGASGSFIVFVWNKGSGQTEFESALRVPGTRAYINGGPSAGATVHAGGKLEVKATDTVTGLKLLAGSVGGGSSAGFGVASAILLRDGLVEASIGQNADIKAASGVGLDVSAEQTEDIMLMSIAGGGASSAGIAGSVTVGVITNVTKAWIGTGATLNGDNSGAAAGQNIAISARDDTDLLGIAGAIAVGGSAGVGVGVDVEVVNKTTEAKIGNSVIANARGNVTVDATSTEQATSIAAGISAGGSASVRVQADEKLTMNIVAGTVSAGGSAGVGVAAVVPVLTKTTSATIGDYASVTGKGNGSALTIKSGSYTFSSIDPRFKSSAVNTSTETITLPTDLGFHTGDTVTYDPGYGTPIGNLAADTVYWVIRDDATHVRLANSKAHADAGTAINLTSQGTGESHRLISTDAAEPKSDDQLRFDPNGRVSGGGDTITLPYDLGLSTGDPIVYSAGGGTPIEGLQDGGTYYVIGNTNGGAAFKLARTKEDAESGSQIDIGTTGMTGKSHSLVKQGNMPSSDASASGPHSVSANELPGFRGVAVTATNSDDVNAVGIAVALGGSAGVGVGGAVNVITVDTTAKVGANAHVNDPAPSGANADQSVFVSAGNQLHVLFASASLSIGGGAGVGVGVGVAVLHEYATALVDDSAIVRAAKDIVITSSQQESIVGFTAAGAGGTAGVAGAVGVIVLGAQSWGKTGTGVTLAAGGNVAILASDDTKVIGITGGAAGGFVGVGVGIYVLSITKSTEAVLGGSSTATSGATLASAALAAISNGTLSDGGFGFASFRGVAIQASSSEDIFGLVLAIGAGAVGVAIPVGVTVASIDTKATLAGSATSSLDVNVSALDKIKTITIAGGVGAGAVGVGAGVDIGIVSANTSATIANGATVNASGRVDVNALTWKRFTTYTFAVGGGAVAVGAAIAVWSMGSNGTDSYDNGQGDSGNALSESGSGNNPADDADGQVSGSGTYQNILDGVAPSTTPSDSGAQKTQSRINAQTSGPASTIQTKGNALGSPTGRERRGQHRLRRHRRLCRRRCRRRRRLAPRRHDRPGDDGGGRRHCRHLGGREPQRPRGSQGSDEHHRLRRWRRGRRRRRASHGADRFEHAAGEDRRLGHDPPRGRRDHRQGGERRPQCRGADDRRRDRRCRGRRLDRRGEPHWIDEGLRRRRHHRRHRHRLESLRRGRGQQHRAYAGDRRRRRHRRRSQRRGRVHAPAPERGERPRLRECVDRGHRWDHRERHGDAGDQRGGHRRRRFWRREPRRLVRAGEQRGERDRLDRQRSRLRFGFADGHRDARPTDGRDESEERLRQRGRRRRRHPPGCAGRGRPLLHDRQRVRLARQQRVAAGRRRHRLLGE
ncbi:MAG: hypothetical protein E6J38_11040, partial [Chloroflexi bacterium]